MQKNSLLRPEGRSDSGRSNAGQSNPGQSNSKTLWQNESLPVFVKFAQSATEDSF